MQNDPHLVHDEASATHQPHTLALDLDTIEVVAPEALEEEATWEEGAESDASTVVPEDLQDGLQEPSLGETGKCCPQEACEQGPSSKQGRHGRLRKDIINLNKAVAKWFRQQAAGEMSEPQVLENIRHSRVARQLRALHGEAFD